MFGINYKSGPILFSFFLVACTAAEVQHSKLKKENSSSTIPYYPLNDVNDLDRLLEDIGDARIVMLGESTHGTSEYYQWRAAITKKLIQEKGFDIIAVEGDWADSYKINQFINGPPADSSAAVDVLKQYDRWPQHMWGNYEMARLVEWLNGYNQGRKPDSKIGFYGLDLYSFWEWAEQDQTAGDSCIRTVVSRIREKFSPYHNDALRYADSIRKSKPDSHILTEQLWEAVQNYLGTSIPVDESRFVLQQHALLALNGERYFRIMVTNRVQSWNLRDSYMAETIKRLLQFRGKNSKALIWLHNGHAGDANYSNMGSAGFTSVGAILRKQFGRAGVYSAAFGTNRGSVLAGYYWNGIPQKQVVLPAKGGSWENTLHQLSPENKIVLSREIKNNDSLKKWIEFRSIGAAYSGAAVYGQSIIPQRFDAFLFIDSTTALHPIPR